MTETEVQHKLDVVTAVRLAVAAVKKRGKDFVYVNCDAPDEQKRKGVCQNWHTTTGSPGCIVGQILYDFGVSKEELSEGSLHPAFNFSRWYVDGWEGATQSFLSTLQGHQDDGAPWGEALRRGFVALGDFEFSPSVTNQINQLRNQFEELV